MSCQIEERSGTWFVSGKLDAHAPLHLVTVSATAPTKVNFGGLESITSIGLRSLREFFARAGKHRVELVECPAFLIDQFNSVRLIDRPEFNVVVSSVIAPFDCDPCGTKGFGQLVAIKDVKLEKNQISAPAKACPNCRAKLKLAVDEHEFFFLAAEVFKARKA